MSYPKAGAYPGPETDSCDAKRKLRIQVEQTDQKIL